MEEVQSENLVDEILTELNTMTVERPSDLVTRYKQAEDTFYDQLRRSQEVLSSCIEEGSPKDIRAMAAVSKDLLNNYNETTRMRKLCEVECGRVVPIKVLENYQKDILPAIASGIDNMRMEIINTLQPQERTAFTAAWNQSYPKFVTVLKEAAKKLDEYLEEARLEATGLQPNKTEGSVKLKEKLSQSAKLRHSRENNLK